MNIQTMNPSPEKRHMGLLHGYRGLLLICCTPLLAAHALADESRTFEQSVQPLLKKYCITCHSTEKQKGDLDLERPFPKTLTPTHTL